MQNKNRNQLNIYLCMAVALLALTMTALCFMPNGLYARFLTSADAGDTARVARFDIDTKIQKNGIEEQSISALVNPKESDLHTILINNKSEVAIRCIVEVENETGNLPLNFKLNDTITVDCLPNSGELEIDLLIEWDETDGKPAYQYQGMVDNIIISVRYEQID